MLNLFLLLFGSGSGVAPPATFSVPVSFKSLSNPVTFGTVDTLYPDNDWGMKVKLNDISLTTAEKDALTSGTITATWHVTRGGSIAHASLTTTLIYIEDNVWLLFFDATLLPDSLIDPLFTTAATADLCVTFPGGFKVWSTVPYARYREAVIA
jgi:hypothetical protein